MGKFLLIDHPLIKHKISIIRSKNCGIRVFREVVHEITMLMAYEIFRDIPLKNITVETPIAVTEGKILSEKDIVIVPILRAGLGMVDGILSLIKTAKIGHIGLSRTNLNTDSEEYFIKLPKNISNQQLIIVDPILATGHSAVTAIRSLKKYGASNFKFACLVSTSEGVKFLQNSHPDVTIYSAALDKELNKFGYIVPGLGDAGDRLFGTK